MGTSAEQFALMGGVFLLLGGAFVFAPQIVSAVNGFMAAVFRRPRKPSKPAPAETSTAPAGPVVHALGTPEHQHHAAAPQLDAMRETAPEPEWAPDEQGEDGHETSAVSRLRQEINVSWSHKNDG